MLVKAIWEFEADVEEFDPKCIDIVGLAKDSAKREMRILLEKNELSADDFEYVVEEETEHIELTEETIDEFTLFKTHYDAQKALDEMIQLTQWYGFATKADFMSIIGKASMASSKDHKMGWVESEIVKAQIRPTRLGWYIEFPQAVSIV